MIDDPYKVLGISPDADKDEIKRAYRKKAKEYHPDLHPDDPQAAEKMNEINEAYDMLNNPEKYKKQQGPGGRSDSYRNPYGGPYGNGNPYGNSYGGNGSYGNPYGQNRQNGYGQGGFLPDCFLLCLDLGFPFFFYLFFVFFLLAICLPPQVILVQPVLSGFPLP